MDDERFPVGQSPPKLSLYNTDTNEGVKVQYNPREIKDPLKVNWTKQSPAGMSHQREQYGYTENQEYEYELVFYAETTKQLDEMRSIRRFIKSLCYVHRGKTSPPRVLLVLGDEIGVVIRVEGLDGGHRYFNSKSQTTYYVTKMKVFESRDGRLWGDDVRRDGDWRPKDTGTQSPGSGDDPRNLRNRREGML